MHAGSTSHRALRGQPSKRGRRHARVACAALCVGLVPPAAAEQQLDAYATPPSVAQGDSVRIHVSTTAAAFDLEILREAPVPVSMLVVRGLPGHQRAVPERVWEEGCGWPASFSLRVPPTWPSGVYPCRLTVAGRILGYAVFVLREDQPGSTSRILFQTSTCTWQAYNGWGGKSLYEFNSGGQRAHVVSFERPHGIALGLSDFYYAERPFVRWLASEGIAVEFCADLDVHADARLLDAYALLLVVGHDEYWSLERREHVEAFTATGGNLGIFAGNTCWLQIRMSPDLRRMTCYKEARLDPLYGVDDRRVTCPWYDAPVSRPENTLTGTSWRHGGFVNFDGWYPAAEGYGGYVAYRTDHWAYAGTGVAARDTFGQAATIVGYETDGALFEWRDGLPVVTGADQTPFSFEILGLSPASVGHATLGAFTPQGTVFNASTTDWSHGLATDPVVAVMTRNVLRRLSTRAPDTRRARLWATPNPARDEVRLRWAGDLGAAQRLVVYGVDGRRVAGLPVRSLALGGSAAWDGRDAGGRAVAAGIYVVHLEGEHAAVTAKVVWIP